MPTLVFTYNRKRATVASVEEAVRIWNEYRESTGAGASEIGNGGTVKDGRKLVAGISYNGRVWSPAEWRQNNRPVKL